MLNHITIMGRLVRDPELRYTQSGVPVASFTVAVDRDYAGQGGDRPTDFIDCVAWRQGGEFVSRYFAKGSMIVVSGRLESRKWQDRDGNNRVSWEINAEHSYFGESKRDSDSWSRTAPLSPAARVLPPQGEASKGADINPPAGARTKPQPSGSGCGFERKNEGADMEFSAYAGNGMERAYSDEEGDDDDNPFVNRQQDFQRDYGEQTDMFGGELPF